MLNKLAPLFLVFLFAACADEPFDESAIPEDQLSTELAFKRMADHGELEPVLEKGQMVDGWQFFVLSVLESRGEEKKEVISATLQDRSGVAYNVTAKNSPEVIGKLKQGTFGFARGRVHEVDRDLAQGNMSVELLLSEWTVREN